MEQAKANQVSFRELDQNGNPLDPARTGKATTASVVDSSGPEGREPRRVSINPFIVALWVLACFLLVGGVGVHMDVISPPDGPFGPDGVYGVAGPVIEMPLTYVLMNFTPYAVLSGTLGIMGLLFWHGVQWQRRRQ
ncbi:hypothetical protein [Arthrobacter sp.]|uniref:hypothetical protein n=1 Tax=Arthrobacter sp. TaxID=1667 RepID=UPI0028128E45|nr:hypothetical protein [Arthrobacter sp.]